MVALLPAEPDGSAGTAHVSCVCLLSWVTPELSLEVMLLCHQQQGAFAGFCLIVQAVAWVKFGLACDYRAAKAETLTNSFFSPVYLDVFCFQRSCVKSKLHQCG